MTTISSRTATEKEALVLVDGGHVIQLISLRDNEDGTVNADFEISNQVKEFIKRYYGRKRFTSKLFKKFVIEALENYGEVPEQEM